MAYEFYVTTKGATQGAFKGESTRKGHEAKAPGISYQHEVSSPRDIATGLASGKRQHKPIVFTKEWGPSSPQFFLALVTNEQLPEVLFEFIKTSREGKEQVYYTIKLVNATVSNIRYATGKGESAGSAKTLATYDTHELEEISLTYQRIEVEHQLAKTAAIDDWNEPNM
jgi:type VI secretion system secreted protein Hcp